MRKSILTLLSILPLAIAAQTITFDGTTQDYKSVSVYDTWEESPFRTNKLKGNVKVIPNFTNDGSADFPNRTANILGVQRSRFGSNTFGVRVDLKEPWDTREAAQYVHVLVYKPNTSKVMLVGLGKRNTSAFTDEPTDVEQFWVESNYTYDTPNEWADMVFPVKTVTGVQIYSLVVVPDLQSRHNYDKDIACYIDEIVVNNSAAQRTKSDYYPINFKNQNNKRPQDRFLQRISLTAADGSVQSHEIATAQTAANTKVYNNLTETVTWDVKAGETYTPSVGFQGGSMHAYTYIDYDDNGQFTPVVTNNKAGDGSEAVSWSGYREGSKPPVYDSNGKQITGWSLTMPAFTIPSNLKPGIYRMRYKVDWNCIDPGGGNEPTATSINMQSTIDNGGGIADILLNVHSDNVKVNAQFRNGSVTTADGTELNDYSTAFGKPMDITMEPAGEFDNDYLVVQHGYKLDGPQYIHGNRQWQSVTYRTATDYPDGKLTLPADIIDGDVSIKANFKQTTYLVLDGDVALSALGTDIYGTQQNVQLNRTFSASAYNTVVLPFSLSAGQVTDFFGAGAKVYAFSNTSGGRIHFTTSNTGTTANVPFLLKTASEESTHRISGVTLEQSASPVAAGSNYDFVGNYGGLITLDEGLWFLSDNTFYRSVGKSTLRGYRAYFRARTESGAKANALDLFIDDKPTGIRVPTADGTDTRTYNLGGQQVAGEGSQALPDGVYVKKNRKVVVKQNKQERR